MRRLGKPVLYLAHYYPPSPQRFLADELMKWRALGLQLKVLAIRKPSTESISLMPVEIQEEIGTSTYLADVALRTWFRGLRACLKRPAQAARVMMAVAVGRYPQQSGPRLRLHAIVTAVRSLSVIGFALRGRYRHIHCDFADDTATIALIAWRVADIPFSFRDYFSFNPQMIEEKVLAARFVLACSEQNRASLLARVPSAESDRVVVDYLGVDLDEWPHLPLPDSRVVVSVGNLQEKKGHLFLLQALARLRQQGIEVTCVVVGDGPLRDCLEAEIDALELRDYVRITGFVSKEEVKGFIRTAQVFCLPAVVASNGDTDGVPFVLMEAMAVGRPCVSTSIGGIEEVIRDGRDGFIVDQKDPVGLAQSLSRLFHDPSLAEQMGRSARSRAEELLDLDRNTRETFALFRAALTEDPSS